MVLLSVTRYVTGLLHERELALRREQQGLHPWSACAYTFKCIITIIITLRFLCPDISISIAMIFAGTNLPTLVTTTTADKAQLRYPLTGPPLLSLQMAT